MLLTVLECYIAIEVLKKIISPHESTPIQPTNTNQAFHIYCILHCISSSGGGGGSSRRSNGSDSCSIMVVAAVVLVV